MKFVGLPQLTDQGAYPKLIPDLTDLKIDWLLILTKNNLVNENLDSFLGMAQIPEQDVIIDSGHAIYESCPTQNEIQVSLIEGKTEYVLQENLITCQNWGILRRLNIRETDTTSETKSISHVTIGQEPNTVSAVSTIQILTHDTLRIRVDS